MEKYSDYTTVSGHKILTNEYIQHLRSLNRPDKYIILQEGGQEFAATSEADIIFYGGERGGGKSFIEIFEAIKDVRNSSFVSSTARQSVSSTGSMVPPRISSASTAQWASRKAIHLRCASRSRLVAFSSSLRADASLR